ncbi:MAG: TraB/GumN family protein [Myxococcota bacterium]
MRFSSWLLCLAFLGCATPSHPTPTYEADPNATTNAGQEEPVANTEPAAPIGPLRPFLYKVQNSNPPSYLFGTIHVGVSLDEALPGTHFEALSAPRTVIVEMDPASVSAQTLADGAVMRRESLSDMLSGVVWHDLSSELSGVMAVDGLRQMRPWFAMMMLMQKRVSEMHEGSPPEAMDLSIVNYARRQEISLVTLERARDQIRALNAVPNAQMARVVSEMVEDRAKSDRQLSSMLDVYRSGDEAQMTQLIFNPEDVHAMPEMYDRLFTRRNRAWLPRIKREVEEGGAFLAVGLGHLLGEDGLIALLRLEGFVVERVE